jgi:hypothetical protein
VAFVFITYLFDCEIKYFGAVFDCPLVAHRPKIKQRRVMNKYSIQTRSARHHDAEQITDQHPFTLDLGLPRNIAQVGS